jgi:hypothetical protein
MHSEKSDRKKNTKSQKKVKFRIDKPFRMFVGEIEGKTVKVISKDKLEGFKDGDKVIIMHSEDWLWFFDELLAISSDL